MGNRVIKSLVVLRPSLFNVRFSGIKKCHLLLVSTKPNSMPFFFLALQIEKNKKIKRERKRKGESM